MKHRSVAAVVILTIFTLGIYGIVWFVKTKGEMKSRGADIPTAWLIIIPIVNIYWVYKYAMGVEKITEGKLSGVLSFILLYFLSIIGMAIIQSEFNKITGSPTAAATSGSPLTDASTPISSNPAPQAAPAALSSDTTPTTATVNSAQATSEPSPAPTNASTENSENTTGESPNISSTTPTSA